jgi:hypothetical protein
MFAFRRLLVVGDEEVDCYDLSPFRVVLLAAQRICLLFSSCPPCFFSFFFSFSYPQAYTSCTTTLDDR